ncbi:hypothetical protein [Aquimarina agarivorans]|uniref:hypothetical protein n=1 Tax=Aquimarina agarivorans TaxID=980584 RepID=UPI000248F8BD|nr:hypothetical protein [Aquimarina agarivorans]
MIFNNSKHIFTLISLLIISTQAFAQNDSPYETNFYKDGAWIAGGIGLSALGLALIEKKMACPIRT